MQDPANLLTHTRTTGRNRHQGFTLVENNWDINILRYGPPIGTDPSQILYMTLGYDRFDENAGKAYAPLPTDGTPKPIYYLENQNALGSFIDGHVEVLKAPIPSRNSNNAGRRVCSDPVTVIT